MKLFPSRTYTTGSCSALWRWTDIHTDGDLYLTRLHIVMWRPLGAIMLHWIHRPDKARDLHDHPVSFLSLVLRGQYWEDIPDIETYSTNWYLGHKTTSRRIRWWNWKRSEDAHRINATHGEVLTLVFAGPKVREWGFYTKDGWKSWQAYEGTN